MANTKEVRKQIASIKSTQKITSAMEMVAASKMKKTQDTMLEGRPYSLKIKDVISHVALANSEYPHPFYEERTPKKACFIVVAQVRLQVLGSGTAVNKDAALFGNVCRGNIGNRLLLLGVPVVPLGDGVFTGKSLEGDRTTVHPAKCASALKDVQVTPYGLYRYVQFVRSHVCVESTIFSGPLRKL